VGDKTAYTASRLLTWASAQGEGSEGASGSGCQNCIRCPGVHVWQSGWWQSCGLGTTVIYLSWN